MANDVNVAIIGAGQAGLATSWYLKQANVDHVVLEAGRVAETWRSRRWDSFCLVTPNWTVQLPGGKYDRADGDGFMGRDALVDYIQAWADSFGPPVKDRCHVTALDQDDGGFVLTTPDGPIRSRSVVVASGGYQRAYRPPNARQMPERLNQMLAEEYRNPSTIAPGGVLVIGSGQTGCQIADELHRAGRKVTLSCGRAPWGPRR
ncbi:MAG TPA: NAD(P)-binding domain-containing protein, partial [Candidatus Dormibacteraeota bacterium]|nr:NAD(P)-binding domain-containing protein [Candidatus Dormibacteraeota bacterium]